MAKVLADYIASNRNTPLKIKGGLVGGKFYTPQNIDALAKVPPREVLIAQMLGSFNAPITGLVGTLERHRQQLCLYASRRSPISGSPRARNTTHETTEHSSQRIRRWQFPRMS